MLSASSQFHSRAKAAMRPLFWRCLMAFDRVFLPGVDFFTIGVSTIGGEDIIKGEGDVVQEWDKYQYSDYSNRLLSMEWQRQVDPVTSLSMAMADFEFDNHDKYFTPHQANSPIKDYILPYRPVKLFAGFGNEAVPAFIGLTEKMPVIDEKRKTAKFHAIDFFYSLMNRPLDETVMLENVRTDEAFDELLQVAGLSATQYDLDLGFNIINFVYFEKGTKLGTAVGELLEAEMGRMYMDENGIIRFKNRQNFSSVPIYTFDKTNNIIDIQTKKQDEIYNVIEIIAQVREVQAKQKFWELQEAIVVPAGSSVEIWADFEDPVTTVDNPVYITSATTSLFTANTEEDGSGTNDGTSITLTDIDKFAKSAKMIFTNGAAYALYITTLELFATPAKIVKEIYVREQDDVSIAKYDERVLRIENNFINNETEAQSKAKIMLADNSTYGDIQQVEVKGNFALQLDDPVSIEVDGVYDTYVITKILNRIMAGKFTQILSVKRKEFQTYFTIGVSTIGGDDVIAP